MAKETYLIQTDNELFEMFKVHGLDVLTDQMNHLESVISQEQRYILKHGEANDRNTDEQWKQMKVESSDNLRVWDAMKKARDYLREQSYKERQIDIFETV